MQIDLYNKVPLKILNNLPVFSEVNNYVENYEKISADHLDHFNRTGENPFMDESYWLSIETSTRKLIQKYSQPGQKILDVGVGMGRLLENFEELDRYGMDISIGYLKLAAEKGIKCCLSLIEDMPFNNNYFDIITCTDVLEHVIDVNLAVKNILRVLKPNGILIVRVPYKEDITWYLSEDCPYEFAHLRTFDENHLKALFTKIFETDVLEWTTAGLWESPTRLKYPIIPYNRWIKFITTFYYDYKKKDKKLYPTFFLESEINFVVRKK